MNPIIYGDDSVVAELTYGSRTDALIQDLRNNLQVQNPLLTDQGRLYAQRSAQVFEQVSGWDVVRNARKAVQAVGSYIHTTDILPLTTVEQLQTANPRMQRWIMADVDVRKFFNEGRIDGYSDMYVDIQPGAYGRDHYDWRCASHGIVNTTETEESVKYEVVQYKMELAKWDEPLLPRGRLDIKYTQMNARSMLLEGADDFSNPYGGKI